MQHELNTLQLNAAASDIQFMHDYLGPQLLPKIEKLFGLDSMPTETLAAYRSIAQLMATLMPEADHVVRDDVDTNANALPAEIGGYLSVYFGVQTPAFETRHQFIGLAYHPDRPDQPWTFYIAGAQDDGNLRSLVNESPATRALNGLSVRTNQDVDAIKPKLEAVARHYRSSIAARKKGLEGFIPATAYQRQQYLNRYAKGKKTEERIQEAREMAFRHFRSVSEQLQPKDAVALKARFKTQEGMICWQRFVQMIFSGFPVEQAFDQVGAELLETLATHRK